VDGDCPKHPVATMAGVRRVGTSELPKDIPALEDPGFPNPLLRHPNNRGHIVDPSTTGGHLRGAWNCRIQVDKTRTFGVQPRLRPCLCRGTTAVDPWAKRSAQATTQQETASPVFSSIGGKE